MIIDPTDFNDRPYKVPNQEESRDFISFITDAEKRLAEGTLQTESVQLLGPDLWADFQAGLNTSGYIEPHWLALRDGADYEYNGRTHHFNGWVDMIRPAIYSLWLPLTTEKVTNIGFVKNNAPQQSKLTEDYYPSIVQYWNDFVRKVAYQTGNCYNYSNTFYGFMKANESDYSNWLFKSPTFKNRYDL